MRNNVRKSGNTQATLCKHYLPIPPTDIIKIRFCNVQKKKKIYYIITTNGIVVVEVRSSSSSSRGGGSSAYISVFYIYSNQGLILPTILK